MKYTKPINIQGLGTRGLRRLQIGQWVTAGEGGPLGRYLGCKKSRTLIVVVGWHENAKRYPEGPTAYWQTLRDYALGE